MKKQRGSAIILALLIVAITTALVSTMMLREETSIRETKIIASIEHAKLQSTLMDNVAATTIANLQNPAEITTPLKTHAIPNGTLSGELTDLQSRFNINNLFLMQYLPNFSNMLHAIDPSVDSDAITSNIHAWLVKNTFMADVSELRLIPGITPKLYEKLKPYVIALPGNDTALNLNTARPIALLSLSASMTPDLATQLIQQRPFDAQSIGNIALLKNLNVVSNTTNSSDYFLMKIVVHFQQENLILWKLVQRQMNNGSPDLRVVWQRQGTTS